MPYEGIERRTSDLETKVLDLQLTSAKGFAEVAQSCDSIKMELLKMGNQQDKIFKLLYGNGEEGIVTKIGKLDQKQNIVWAIFSAVGVSHFTFLTMAAVDMLQLFQ